MNDTYDRVVAIGGRFVISLITALIAAMVSTRFTPVWGIWFWLIMVAALALSFLCLCLFGAQPNSESGRG